MQRVDFNRGGWQHHDPAASIRIWMGASKYDWYQDKHVPHGVIVHEFGDVVRATRKFG